MQYLHQGEIKNLQIDHTSKCNLQCPQCARNDSGKPNPSLPLDELSLADYKAIITPTVSGLEQIVFCGNYGDAIVSNTFMPSLKWIVNESGFSGNIRIMTNGSARDTAWWAELAGVLRKKDQVNFSIDGLADTNHLYRVNSDFNKIIANATAFINAGGRARWDYLVFGHNEHQVDEAIELAKKLKFDCFQIKQTNRFINGETYNKKEVQTPEQIAVTRKGEHVIAMPASAKYQGSGKSQSQLILDKYGSWDAYVNATPIQCKKKPIGGIFIDFEARIWACTWTAGGIYYIGDKNKQRVEAHTILDRYGQDFNSLRHHSLDDIMKHEYYAEKLCASWSGKTSDEVPKLFTCGRTCGTDYEFSSVHGDNNKLIELGQI